MRNNPLQFAVVREDAFVERAVLTGREPAHALLIASGGCTAISLARWFPRLAITLVDPNPAQLAHVRSRTDALARGASLAELSELAERGNFESLFRALRGLVHDLVAPRQAWEAFFDGTGPNPLPLLRSSPTWPAALGATFSDPLLHAMFGPAATQYAVPGSYPEYFRSALERGLELPSAADNPFLHHVFLGNYIARCPPVHCVATGPALDFALVEAGVEDIDLSPFGFLGLSNIFDWMAPDAVRRLAQKIVAEAQPGAIVLFRQLNNDRPVERELEGGFDFDPAFGERLRAIDRSHFYRSIHVGIRR